MKHAAIAMYCAFPRFGDWFTANILQKQPFEMYEYRLMWKRLRIFILLVILATVMQQSMHEDAALDWKRNFYVALYPVNADQSAEVGAYIKTLSADDFEPVAEYFATQAQHYQLNLRRPVEIKLGAEVKRVPPPPPEKGNFLNVMLWSLQFRYFAWVNSPKLSIKPDIRLYLLYHDPKKYNSLTHSTALNKGRIGRVNLFADHRDDNTNLVVLAHELLHTVKATDKYDISTNLPLYPDGYAAPEQQPRYPQPLAELMGGRVPISEHEAKIPASLQRTMIGIKTAREIGWIK